MGSPMSVAILRERVALYGPARLGDAELLLLLLSGPLARRRRIAAQILDGGSGATALLALTREPADLDCRGLAPAERDRLIAALELGRRAAVPAVPRTPIREPAEAYACVAAEVADAATERFIVVVLDVHNRPRHIAPIAIGSVDACPVDPREVFVHAVGRRGSGIIVAHNHPSGDPTPSTEDIALTQRLVRAGSLLGVPLLDHIIVGAAGRFTSLAEAGIVEQAA